MTALVAHGFPAVHPVVQALALLASVGAAVVLFLAVSVIAWMLFGPRDDQPMTTEPDPIESYPTRIRCGSAPLAPSPTIEPDLVAHLRTLRCPVESPHLIAACGEFAAISPSKVQPRNLA